MSDSAGLIVRQATDHIAWICQSKPQLSNVKGPITADRFISHVKALASHLPNKQYCINLCDNRYLFMVSLCAIILREQTNLFPSNKTPETQRLLFQRYDECYVIHDGDQEIDDALDHIEIDQSHLADSNPLEDNFEVPLISLDHIAAIIFTSGSTGESKPIIKTWRTMVDSTSINQRYMQPDTSRTSYCLATVPGQHMWGFETSVLMPLFKNVCAADSRPLYPLDVLDHLNELPLPRTLITTPFHIKSILHANLADFKIDKVLIATAPLDQSLAQQVEDRFSTDLLEIYGASEVGSMSIRSTAKTHLWTRFDKLNFIQNGNRTTTVSAQHLPEDIVLDDRLNIIDSDHFELIGRSNDQIEIAGKRGSLQEINAVLGRFEGVSDGVVIFPEQDREVPRVVALVVFNDGVSKEDLRQYFRRFFDSAFVPRPILEISQLPRLENGKLSKPEILKLYKSLIK